MLATLRWERLSMLTHGAAAFLAIDLHSSVLANASTPANLALTSRTKVTMLVRLGEFCF